MPIINRYNLPDDVPYPTLGSRDINVCYTDYIAAAEVLCRYIERENEYLFIGKGRIILSDIHAKQRKAWLMACHKFCAERIIELLATNQLGDQSIRKTVMDYVSKIRRLMSINQVVLLDEIRQKQQRVDIIMEKINSYDKKDLAAIHNDEIINIALDTQDIQQYRGQPCH